VTSPAPRPRLESMLDGAMAHRLTVLVADAGFGKTTLLSSWSAGINAVVCPLARRDSDLTTCWRGLVGALQRSLGDLPELALAAVRGPATAHGEAVRAQAMAELLGQVLGQRLTRDLVLAFDDAHLVEDGPSGSFLAGLVRHAPPLLHVVLSTRVPPSVPTGRLRTQGQVLEMTGTELAFTTGEVATLLGDLPGGGATGLAEEIRSASGGWPIAVRLSVEALRDVEPAARAGHLTQLAGPHGELTDLLGAIYQQESPAGRRVLAIGALLGAFTVPLCAALGVQGAAGVVADMARRRLFLEPVASMSAPSGTGRWYRLHPLARRFVREQAPLPAGEATRLHQVAADWFAAHDQSAAALRSLMTIGETGRAAALLTQTGDQLVSGGQPDAVIDTVTALPGSHRDATIELLAGNAYLVRGQWEEALACLRRAAGGGTPQPPGLAWRIGLIHYLRGEHDQALAAYQQGDASGPPTRDTAMLLAWEASAHWILGDLTLCGERAVQALAVATTADDPAALAASHTVLSMLAAVRGDRRANAAHYRKALEYAERASDVLQLIRIHTNRASHHLEEGTYAEAMAELDVAIRLADLSSYGTFGAVALSNRAEIRLRQGQLEEAQRDIEGALQIFEDLGSRSAAYPLWLLGRLQQLRGDRAAARRAYERALVLAEHSGDLQITQPLLAGLARLLAGGDEHQLARKLAERALSYDEGMGRVEARLAAARVAVAGGDLATARTHAQVARATADARRDRAGVAEALEIEALATEDPARARELAGRSAAQWAEMADPIGQAGADLAYADRLDDPAARTVAEAVRRRMEEIGCRWMVERAEAVGASRPSPRTGPVRVETLGTFRLVRDGVAAPASAWRSRKARDVLKILLARRGRPVTREFLMEVLWPGEPPEALTNRLHVAVSTLRSVLDPGHRFDSQHFVATDDDAVRVCLEHLEADVESFLDDASTGLSLLRAGRPGDALPRLARAESRYGGDFLEEDLYADWAVPLREQARAAYLSVAARLAQHAEASGDVDAATRYLLRILEHDSYDERAHLQLVAIFAASGRHGDARRHYRHYCARMDELEVEAAPFPG
jgi:ATP/maltotriose-dependent transcriptional regulator MalT/DNA-binding SARP family transcriptional activator